MYILLMPIGSGGTNVEDKTGMKKNIG